MFKCRQLLHAQILHKQNSFAAGICRHACVGLFGSLLFISFSSRFKPQPRFPASLRVHISLAENNCREPDYAVPSGKLSVQCSRVPFVATVAGGA